MSDPLFQPFKLKNTTFKNRVFSAAHEPAFTEDGMTAKRYIAYHEEKAKGGMAMSMIGGSTVVSRDSPATFGNVDASTDRVIEWWGKLAQTVHVYDCKVITQLTHLGRRTSWADPDWLPLMSASCVREQAHKQYPKAVELEDINRIKAEYVGAGHCIDQIYHSGAAYCIHNPSTGREQTIPQLVEKGAGPTKRVIVIGAGPAGMEAARVCKLRGHDVKILEASSTAGGQLLIASRAPRRRDLIGIVDWLKGELEHIGVPIEYNRYVAGGDLAGVDVDIVIIATGGMPNVEFFESGHDLCVSSWDVLTGQVRLSGDILLYDENGAEAGVGTAEYLLDQGQKVQMVTPDRLIGTHIGPTNYPAALKEFYNAGMQMTTDHRLVSLRREGGKIVARLWCDITSTSVEKTADHVVVENGTLPADDVYFELKKDAVNLGMIDIDALADLKPQTINLNEDGKYQLFRIGDAVASRSVHASMFEARRLCMVF
ncbi:MAG TPA: hypothetical protein DCS89_12840 [Gammaproteobacteria bacterium]|nr:hypothetical protein [Gammaproteobacteria bacterium]|tara:strand:- start:1248 stop:2699 length:1452 start_codon:yes stop_codon:yes gene_type:complete